MRVNILLQITTDDGAPGDIEEIASFGRSVERAKNLGLSLAENKTLRAAHTSSCSPIRSRMSPALPQTPMPCRFRFETARNCLGVSRARTGRAANARKPRTRNHA